MKYIKSVVRVLLVLCLAFCMSACSGESGVDVSNSVKNEEAFGSYRILNGGVPEFTEIDLTTDAFEEYSELDTLGRCGVAYANICREIMPTEERGKIGAIRPSGWHTVKYNDIIEGNYLYNRCHLIGYQLAGENDNEKNLITGTRYLNVQGMLPFENQVAEYVEETGNHVLYRVTPVYEGDNLVASGVQMEAMSVEDEGEDISFNVFVYNTQPGIVIDYATGESWRDESYVLENDKDADADKDTGEDGYAGESETLTSNVYVLNKNTKKFHHPSCSSVVDIYEKNREEFIGEKEELIGAGYIPCKRCNP